MKEKVKPDSTRKMPKKVQGTVLFTVVCVMMVLIVFLMGTLALATTANNRAYGNYQKEQTEYTARTVLDATVQAINEDTTSTGIKSQIVGLGVGSDMTVTVTGTDGLSENVTITNLGSRTVYNAAAEQWVSGKIYEVAAEINRTKAQTRYSAYIVDASVTPPGGGGGGGAFVSLGGLGGKIGTSGFTAGGTEIGIDGTGNEDYELDNGAVQMVPFYLNGNLDTKSQCSVYFNKIAKQQYYAVTGNLTISNTFDLQYSSDFAWDDSLVTDYKEVPTVYVGGTLKVTSNNVTFGSPAPTGVPMNVYVGAVDTQINFNVYGDLYATDPTATSSIRGNEGSTKLHTWVDKQIKGKDGSVKTEGFGNFYSAGNVEYDTTANNDMYVGKSLRVAKNLTISGNKTIYVGDASAYEGDVACGGTLTINGNLKCGKLYADNLVVNGTLNCTDVTANHISGSGTVNASGTVKSADVAAVYPVQENVWYTDYIETVADSPFPWGPFHIEYTINKHTKTINSDGTSSEIVDVISETRDGIWGNNPSERIGNINGDYKNYDSEATAWSNPLPPPAGLTNINAPTILQGQPIKTVDELYGKKVYPDGFTKTDILNDVIQPPAASRYSGAEYPTTLQELNATITILDGHGNLLPSVTDFVEGTDGTATHPINRTGVLKGGWSTDIYIDAATPIVLIVDNFSLQSGHDIVIKDTAKVYFFIQNSFNMLGGNIWTQDYKNLLNSGASLTITEEQPSVASPYYPNVYVFAAAGASFNSSNNRVVTANFRAPKLNFTQDNGYGTANSINYVQTAGAGTTTKVFPAGSHIGVIGQLVCGKITVTNGWGLIFVRIPTTPTGCTCGCPTCTGLSGCTCCDSGTPCCASCTCGSGGPHTPGVPDEYSVLYYNYF